MDGGIGDATARLEATDGSGGRILAAHGRLDAAAAARLWPAAMRAAEGGVAVLDLSGIETIDTAGALLLLTAAPGAERRGAEPSVAAMLD
ncbi:STAS domain-containing protein, partial [Roseomonas rubea]|uniref:STAS domain-containing protein n=1 Tax=Neoroseomonas rubea TaxID=2748666 RepID=UPI0018DF046D